MLGRYEFLGVGGADESHEVVGEGSAVFGIHFGRRWAFYVHCDWTQLDDRLVFEPKNRTSTVEPGYLLRNCQNQSIP